MSKVFILLVVCLIVVGGIGYVSATDVNYYFNPGCGHCQKIAPFIQQIIKNYPTVTFNVLDTSQGSYKISGTPTAVIITNDKRDITLTGSADIPKYLGCEINEMSTLDCPTSTQLNCLTNSFFIR